MIQLAQTTSPYPSDMDTSMLQAVFTQDKILKAQRASSYPELNPSSNPKPDFAVSNGHISPADWDELFHAIQVRLELCVGDALLKSPQLAPNERNKVIKTTILQCVEAMQQLHTALTIERKDSNLRYQLHGH